MTTVYLLFIVARQGISPAVLRESGAHRTLAVWVRSKVIGGDLEMGARTQRSGILLVCPYGLFRHALALLLERHAFAAVSQAASASDARKVFASEKNIDLILLCACDEDPDEQDLVARICDESPNANIVLVAAKFDAGQMMRWLDAGVDGYLVADISPEALVHALELVRHGERVFPSELAAQLTASSLTALPAPEQDTSGILTPRETEIVAYLVQGDSNKAIANALGLTEATVKMHLRQIFSKVGATNRTQAAAWAMNNGVASPN